MHEYVTYTDIVTIETQFGCVAQAGPGRLGGAGTPAKWRTGRSQPGRDGGP